MKSSIGIFLIAGLTLFAMSACEDEKSGTSPLVCELADQCIVAYRDGMFTNDYDDFKGFCECDIPDSDWVGPCYDGTFHTGACDRGTIVASCASQDRSRFYYDNFGVGGGTIDTHEEVEALARVCTEVDFGTFRLETLNLCDGDGDCDNGIACDGQERCVVEETCSLGFCTQATCQPSAERFCPEGQFCDLASDTCM